MKLGKIRANVYPTENVEKVEKAIKNIIGDISLRLADGRNYQIIEGDIENIEDLKTLRDVMRKMQIRTAANSLLINAASENHLSFGLNKQAAYVGKVSFHSSGVSPLGPIQIEIHEKVEEVIQYLCT